MEREVGDRNFPIWLIGDSNPKNWQDELRFPLDPRHPTRHSIWTPILEVMQDRIYRNAGLRLDTHDLYIRNALEDPDRKPSSQAWGSDLMLEVENLKHLLQMYRPVLVLTFGAFAFEFVNRSQSADKGSSLAYWTTKQLGGMFRLRVNTFAPDRTNVLPLLHASIARGRFRQSHAGFCGTDDANYFEYVGEMLAVLLLRYQDSLPIWIARDR